MFTLPRIGIRCLIGVAFAVSKAFTYASVNITDRALLVDEHETLDHESLYSTWDDASWAIWSTQLSSQLGDKQRFYDSFIESCIESAGERGKSRCVDDEEFRIKMNVDQPRSMKNYTKHGFKKIKAPKEVFKLVQDFWNRNRHDGIIEWDHVTPYHNNWQVPPTILKVDNTSLDGGGPLLVSEISNAARRILEEWTGQKLTGSSVYGIRVYHNQSILTPHVDRLPLVSSAIINVDQDVDEAWFLEVYDHAGRAHNVSMEPGEMVLYESHSVVHGRPFPLNGNFFANVFVHFQPLGQMDSHDNLPEPGSLPPYLIPNSVWEEQYWDDNPEGWNLLWDIERIIYDNDIETLRYVAQRDPRVLRKPLYPTTGCEPIHTAAEAGNADALKFLIDEIGIDVNTPCHIPYGVTSLTLALQYFHDTEHPAVATLLERGGKKFLDAHGVAARQEL